MKKIEAVVRPSKLEAIRNALVKYGIRGMSVCDVYGCGLQKGHTAVYRGKAYDINLLPKVKLEVVVTDDYVDEVVAIIVEHGQTGEVGDGKIFVHSLGESYRIRTGAAGKDAINGIVIIE